MEKDLDENRPAESEQIDETKINLNLTSPVGSLTTSMRGSALRINDAIVSHGSPKPQWKRPLLHGNEEEKGEIGELERTAEEFGISLDALIHAFEAAELEELNDEDWLSMVNSDSSDPGWDSIEAVRTHLEGKRNFAIIEEGLTHGHTLPAPVVLFLKGHRPYCIGGNSRLLGCRALNIRPFVLAIRLEDEDYQAAA